MAIKQQFGLTLATTMTLSALYFAACDSEPAEQLTTRSLEGNHSGPFGSGGDAFELDGNKADDAAQGSDWGDGGPIASFTTSEMPLDPPPLSVFSGGQSKDHLDISKWRHKNGSVPSKDDILAAYAASYVNPDSDLIIYFGAERAEASGDSHIGFWFFQEDVGLNPNGTFSGTHTVGDVLVLANFVNGGSAAEIQVLEWVGTGGEEGDGALHLLYGGDAKCDGAEATDACAITNTAPFDSYPAHTFFEGGVNISSLFAAAGQPLPCYASFMTETRSSTSVSAVLKDFVLGSFGMCGLSISATCMGSEVNLDGGYTHTYDVTVHNPGVGQIYNLDIMTSAGGLDAPDPNVLAPNGQYSQQVVIESDQADVGLAASVTAATDPNGPSDLSDSVAVEEQPMCHGPVYSPALTVENSCDAKLEDINNDLTLEYVVDFKREVCNTTVVPDGADPLAMDVEISDPDTAENLGIFALMPGECKIISSSYHPSSADEMAFGLTTKAINQTPFFGDIAVQSQTASCGLCF